MTDEVLQSVERSLIELCDHLNLPSNSPHRVVLQLLQERIANASDQSTRIAELEAENSRLKRDSSGNAEIDLLKRVDSELRALLSACQKENTALRRQLSQEELDHENTIDHRDRHEQSLNELFNELGMSEEDSRWSSLNNPVDRAKEYIAELDAQLAARDAKLTATTTPMRSGCCNKTVYFNAEANNFYCENCKAGQGNEFYRVAGNRDAEKLVCRLQQQLDEYQQQTARERQRNSGTTNAKIVELAKDHYWESLEPHRNMILVHIYALAALAAAK